MGGTRGDAFVGRERERARMAAQLEAAASGRPGALLVRGEAGAGKSRLLREFAAEAERAGSLVVTGGGLPFSGGGLPYGPVLEALEGLLDALPAPERQELLGRADELRALRDGRGTVATGRSGPATLHGYNVGGPN